MEVQLELSTLDFIGATDGMLSPCQLCGRKFHADRIAKHMAICEKVKGSKRPVFKSELQRTYHVGGSDGEVIGVGQAHSTLPDTSAALLRGLRQVSRNLRQRSPSNSQLDPNLPLAPVDVRRLQRLQTRDLTPEDYDLLLRLDEGVAKKTLSADLCQQLPKAAASIVEATKLCAICYSSFGSDEDVRALPCCDHVFHAECITKWLTSSSPVCPLDKFEVRIEANASALAF